MQVLIAEMDFAHATNSTLLTGQCDDVELHCTGKLTHAARLQDCRFAVVFRAGDD